jgi:hypothetical protein
MIINVSSFGHILGSIDKNDLDLNLENRPFSQELQVGPGHGQTIANGKKPETIFTILATYNCVH